MVYELYENGVCIKVIGTRTVSNSAHIKIQDIKECCKKSIEETGLSWMVEREVSGGKAVPEEIKNACIFYRDKSNRLELLINGIAENAIDDFDQGACDQIEQIDWYSTSIQSQRF